MTPDRVEFVYATKPSHPLAMLTISEPWVVVRTEVECRRYTKSTQLVMVHYVVPKSEHTG